MPNQADAYNDQKAFLKSVLNHFFPLLFYKSRRRAPLEPIEMITARASRAGYRLLFSLHRAHALIKRSALIPLKHKTLCLRVNVLRWRTVLFFESVLQIVDDLFDFIGIKIKCRHMSFTLGDDTGDFLWRFILPE